MSVFSKLFGNVFPDDSAINALSSRDSIEPLSLQLLFRGKRLFDDQSLTEALHAYHPTLAGARCEFEHELTQDGRIFGLIRWRNHAVQVLGLDEPMPSEAVENCVQPADYPAEMKEAAREHKSHVLLYYGGREKSLLEEYVALASVAGAMAPLGCIVVLNESARTSVPARLLTGLDGDLDRLAFLRSLPLTILYCGFVRLKIEGVPGVWVRTYGAGLMGMPNLAAHTMAHEEGQHYHEVFSDILTYLLESGATLAAGHTLQTEAEEYLRFREPSEDEKSLKDDGEVLVAETIGPDEINRK